MKLPDSLILSYKGRDVVVLSEAEILNNTLDGLIQTGFLQERLIEAVADVGVFNDIYQPKAADKK